MNEFLSLTEIGKLYGVSSHVVGRWLKDLGLRTEKGKPSQQAFYQELVIQRPSRQPGTFYYVWERKRIIELLDGMGYPRTS